MKVHGQNFSLLVRRMAWLMVLFSISRIFFFLFNLPYFENEGLQGILKAFFVGLRYDITAIVIVNLLFILLHILPLPFFNSRNYQRILLWIFIIGNTPMLLLNCIDIGLFRFTGKRSGSEIFSILSFGNDFINTVPEMIADFWYLLVIFFALIFGMIRYYPKVSNRRNTQEKFRPVFRVYAVRIVLMFFFGGMAFIGFRGGVQYKPLNILSASGYGSTRLTSLILNSPFTVIKTFGKNKIEEYEWMPAEKALEISPVIHEQFPSIPFQSKNVVIIILESFGKEYISCLNGSIGYTPFLDSLAHCGLLFTHAYANAKRSIEGIPAIVAGIPSLMKDPFITSAYSGNSVTSLASLLKARKYNSCFYHGGTNGTMGFDNFSKLAGYDRYFGRSEYNNDTDFDGSWGIYDEPFLQRVASELGQASQPFFATVFTLSSHHPYKIPEKYQQIFPEGTLPIHQSIRYADYALRRFFETAAEMRWYDNTLFVITADHTALSEKSVFMTNAGMHAIPILYFAPDNSGLAGRTEEATQQIDILPSVMDYLHYDEAFFAFGKSVFDSTHSGFAIQYLNENYQLIQENYLLTLDPLSRKAFYNLTKDSLMRKNLAGKGFPMEDSMELKLKSFVQNFNHVMIHNLMK